MGKPRLSHCRKLLSRAVRIFAKKRSLLSPEDQHLFAQLLIELNNQLATRAHRAAKESAIKLKHFLNLHYPKNFFTRLGEFCAGILGTLVVAILIRQMWFELYQVPTGSMRPTILEQDRMVVSKTSFGITLPFTNKQLLFNPDFVLRNGIVVFTVRGMDVADPNFLYFYLFPGKKQFIKRCCAKGGDIIYFYGGRIYGIDKQGNPFTEMYDESNLQKLHLSSIEHIPCISFEGKIEPSLPEEAGVFQKSIFKQMNIPVASLDLSTPSPSGTFLSKDHWITEDLSLLNQPHDAPVAFSELWGIGNYAIARLLSPEEVIKIYKKIPPSNGVLFLELHHTPNLSSMTPHLTWIANGAKAPSLATMTTLIPLQAEHIERIHSALYTSRFDIKNQRAYLYSGKKSHAPTSFEPLFPHVKDGTYEIEQGIPYSIRWSGIRVQLPPSHPLASTSSDMVKKLFNTGVGINLLFQPQSEYQAFLPSRFAYFREGDLYLLGIPLFKKTDPILQDFVTQELSKEQHSLIPYVAFIDRGPPLASDGSLDRIKIKNFGLPIPEDFLLGLGDNYSMSADSRDFGFVPYQNLRGSPQWILWPNHHWGPLPQQHGKLTTLPNLIIQGLGWGSLLLLWIWYRTRHRIVSNVDELL